MKSSKKKFVKLVKFVVEKYHLNQINPALSAMFYQEDICLIRVIYGTE